MAEIKDGKIIFTSEEQPYVDKLMAERVSREKVKYDELKTQSEELAKDKDLANKTLNEQVKKMEKIEAQLKALGIEKDNLKEFQKEYEANKLIIEKYNQEKLSDVQKKAFIEAGGNADKFEKAIKLVSFKDKDGKDIDPKAAFTELLKDDDLSILRGKVEGDPVKVNKGGDNPNPKDNKLTSWGKNRYFPKEEK